GAREDELPGSGEEGPDPCDTHGRESPPVTDLAHPARSVRGSRRASREGVDERGQTPATTTPSRGSTSNHRCRPRRWKTRPPGLVRTTSSWSPVVVAIVVPGRPARAVTRPPTSTR